MTEPTPRIGARLFGSILKWFGLLGMIFGLLSSGVAVRFLFSEPKPEANELNFDPMIGHVNKLALGLLLGSMFFTLAGSALLLISRPLVRVHKKRATLRWPKIFSYLLFIYSAAVFGLAIVLINELSGAASNGIIAGLVTYCVMAAIGLLISSWGLKRFADVE